MATEIKWADGVNKDFFDVQIGVKNNIKKLTFESGKERRYLLNSSPKKTFSLSVSLWNEEEENAFWDWYDNTILSGALSFTLPDLTGGNGETEYIFTEPPNVEDIFPKTAKLTVEEY